MEWLVATSTTQHNSQQADRLPKLIELQRNELPSRKKGGDILEKTQPMNTHFLKWDSVSMQLLKIMHYVKIST